MASTMGTNPSKQVCRLCCYETADTTNVFSEKGIEFDYEGKITKYLYLHVSQRNFASCESQGSLSMPLLIFVLFSILDRCDGRIAKGNLLDVHAAFGNISQILRKGK